jgi:4-carboxymuconolactone decarboxylase
MARIDPLKPEDMNDEQRQAYDEVIAKGGRVGGPNGVYIRVPELFKLNQDMGNYLRNNHVNARLRQLAAIVAVRRWNGAYAWGAQGRDALAAGISQEILNAINKREVPVLEDPDDQVVYDAAVELSDTGTLSDALFEKAQDQLGFNGVLDLVAAVGFFTAVAQAVSVFEVEPRPQFPTTLAP